MTISARLPAALLVVVLLAGVTACGQSDPTPVDTGSVETTLPTSSALPADLESAAPTSTAGRPSLTPVPGGSTPEPPDEGGGTTLTEWGRILDRVPFGFPVYPGAEPADGVSEPTSGAWVADAAAARVASWYVGAFKEVGWSSIDLGSALEDGTQVLDLASDLPECRVQVTFRPAGRSTMILVLYGAGCAGGDA